MTKLKIHIYKNVVYTTIFDENTQYFNSNLVEIFDYDDTVEQVYKWVTDDAYDVSRNISKAHLSLQIELKPEGTLNT